MENQDLELTMKIENDIFDADDQPEVVTKIMSEEDLPPLGLDVTEEEPTTEDAIADVTEVVEETNPEIPGDDIPEELTTFDETIVISDDAEDIPVNVELEEASKTNWFFVSAILFGIMAGLAIITACFTFLFNFA